MLTKLMIAAGLTTALTLMAFPGFADVGAGKAVYMGKGCIGCHGPEGNSLVPTYPSLAGRDVAWVKQTLTAFRGGTRANPTMNAMSASLSDADIANLADYIGSLK
jgi:cytochrome c553